MQRAAFRDPPAMFLSVPTDAFPMTVIQHGAGAALFDCGVTAGVGCVHGVPLISSQPAFAVARLGCALLCMVFFLFIATVIYPEI